MITTMVLDTSMARASMCTSTTPRLCMTTTCKVYMRVCVSLDDETPGIFLHVLADTMGSVGVIVSSVLVEWYDLHIADPICSLCISVLIFASILPLLRRASMTLLQCTPPELDEACQEMHARVAKLDGVYGVSDIHVWTHGASVVVCTIHVVLSQDVVSEQRMLTTVTGIAREAGITHVTVEFSR